MQERAWVKDFFTRWQRKHNPVGDDRAFYKILRQFHPETLTVTALDIQRVEPESEEDAELVALWRAWNEFVNGNMRAGSQKIKKIAKSLKHRPEPFALMGASSLLRGDRSNAYKALLRAHRLSPRDQQIQLLRSRLGTRRPPVLSFLGRTNPINIQLGRLRSKFISE